MIDLPTGVVEIDIPFHDIDAMEVAWHGHYAKYFEIARCVLLDKIAYNYREMRESGYAWPVIEMKIRYIKPARYPQRIRVEARIEEYELRLKLGYRVTDVATGERLTKGYTIQVAVDMKANEMLLGSPKILHQKLGLLP
jgi:acyl-CoA thioester hydrolase